jgi:nucleotide-binding universal stress UspA family protein
MLAVMRFVIGTDGSVGARTAVEFLGALPLSNADHVTVLTVPVYSFMGTAILPERPDLLRDRGLDAAHAVAESARQRLAAHGVPVRVVVRSGPVADELQLTALEDAADVVVIGSRGLGAIAGTILGSVARALARHASISVLVVRERRGVPTRVVAAIDGSQEAWDAVKLVARFPLPGAAPITLLQLPSASDACRWAVSDEARALLATHPIDARSIEGDHAADQILSAARAVDADLIVLGSRGMTAGSGVLGASLADQVLSQAHCAVLVAKPRLTPRVVTEAHAVARVAVAL